MLLRDEIAQLLRRCTGDEFLKQLFWSTLGYNRVNQPVPPAFIPVALRRDIDATIFAQHESVYVFFMPVNRLMLDDSLENKLIAVIAREWPGSLTVFTNLARTEWDFCWCNNGRSQAHRIQVDADSLQLERLAGMLAALSPWLAKSGDALKGLELQAKLDARFSALHPRKRVRNEDEENLVIASFRSHPLLSEESERDLVRRYKEHDDLEAREKLILCNLRWVVKIAYRFCNRGLDLDELIQEGCIGLMRAIERFELRQGTKLCTYSTCWIEQKIRRALIEKAHLVCVPAYMHDTIHAWRKYARDVVARTGRYAAIREYFDIHKICKSKRRAIIFGVRACKAHGDDSSLPYRVAEEMKHVPIKDDFEYAEIAALVKALKPREQNVLEHRYGLNGRERLVLEAIGKKFKLTRERIRQIEELALKKLRIRARKMRKAEAHAQA